MSGLAYNERAWAIDLISAINLYTTKKKLKIASLAAMLLRRVPIAASNRAKVTDQIGDETVIVKPETLEAVQAVEAAWDKLQSVCGWRAPDRDDEGQGRICENLENTSGMEWCDPSHCPLLDIQ